jgi:hypothetical protein
VAAEDKQIDVALASEGAVAAADSLYREDPQFGAANAIDGKWIGPGDDPAKNRCSFGDVPHPHWLWIRFRQPARISRMLVHRAHDIDYPVDFVGEYSGKGSVHENVMSPPEADRPGERAGSFCLVGLKRGRPRRLWSF